MHLIVQTLYNMNFGLEYFFEFDELDIPEYLYEFDDVDEDEFNRNYTYVVRENFEDAAEYIIKKEFSNYNLIDLNKKCFVRHKELEKMWLENKIDFTEMYRKDTEFKQFLIEKYRGPAFDDFKEEIWDEIELHRVWTY